MGSHRDGLIAVGVIFLTINTVVVFARVYTRTIVVKGSLGWDDFTLCLTYIGYVIAYAFLFAAMHYGYAAEDTEPWYDVKRKTLFTYANQTTIYISAGLVKVAVALVLLRIAVGKGIRRLLIGSIVVVGLWTIVTVLFASWICASTGQSNWAETTTCARVAMFRTISNIFIDYFYALLPISILWDSPMKTRLKMIVIFLFGLGILASTATIAKLVIIVRLSHAAPSEEEALHYDLAVWADLELGLAIFAASAVALRPLLRYIPTLFDDSVPSGGRCLKDNNPYNKLEHGNRGYDFDNHE
ncbi:hypothetical protein GGR51DRAFT_356240 [Nemania sp. FL0031]|nr:hypothetical protein GGR51DRAFT_356240 [Nemania sp. FL0031]